MNTYSWNQFGLKENPYENKPLTEGGSLPIDKAFIGRTSEITYLTNLFLNEDNACLILSGDVGVGKTSLINFFKYKVKYHQGNKPLFSSRREIEINPEMLNKRAFLLEIMGSVLREIQLVDNKLLAKPTLQKIQKLVDMTYNRNVSLGLSGGFEPFQAGINVGKDSSLEKPLQMPLSTLEKYYAELLTFILTEKIGGKQYQGLIIHVNNFDSLLYDRANKNKIIAFFHEIRDILQLPHSYFVFLGPRNFFKEIISPQQRIKGVFVQSPLMLDPLSKEEIVHALNERLQLLKSDDVVNVIKPFEDEVIYQLYDLYRGDLRSIMSGLKDILGQFHFLGKNISVRDAMSLLGQQRWQRIEVTANLTPEQTEILKYFAQTSELVTQKDLVKVLNKTKESMSGYYFKTLKENGIIEEKKKVGNTKYWALTEEYAPIRFIFKQPELLKE